MIQRHVKTRKVTNVRAHAQKFLLKLVKYNEEGYDKGDTQDDEVVNAELYYNLLTGKMHKTFSK